MDTSNDKLTKSHARRPGHGYEGKRFGEKSLLTAVQRNAVRTNYIKAKIDHTQQKGGARGVMVIVVGNGHGDTSSNPGRD